MDRPAADTDRASCSASTSICLSQPHQSKQHQPHMSHWRYITRQATRQATRAHPPHQGHRGLQKQPHTARTVHESQWRHLVGLDSARRRTWFKQINMALQWSMVVACCVTPHHGKLGRWVRADTMAGHRATQQRGCPASLQTKEPGFQWGFMGDASNKRHLLQDTRVKSATTWLKRSAVVVRNHVPHTHGQMHRQLGR